MEKHTIQPKWENKRGFITIYVFKNRKEFLLSPNTQIYKIVLAGKFEKYDKTIRNANNVGIISKWSPNSIYIARTRRNLCKVNKYADLMDLMELWRRF